MIVGCNSPEAPDCLKSTGRTQTVSRSFASLPTILEVRDNIDVFITYDSVAGITIEGGKNILPDILLEETAEGHYTLRNANTCNWVRSYKRKITARVTLPATLRELRLYGSGEVIGQNTWKAGSPVSIDIEGSLEKLDMQVEVGRLNLNVGGYGAHINLRGTVGEGFIETLDFPNMDLSELSIYSGIVKQRAGTDLRINATHYLWTQIHGTGNLILISGPPVNEPAVETFNTGRLIYE